MDDLLQRYLNGMALISTLEGAKLRAASEKLWAIADQVTRRSRGFDWVNFWRENGIWPEPAPPPFVPTVEDWSDLDLESA